LTYSEAKKEPIVEVHLDKVLEGLNMNMDQFTDLCILLGCDFCDTIKGIGLKRAVELMHKYGSIEKVIANLDHAKHPVPERFPFEEVRELFKHPEIDDCKDIEFKWKEPDEEGLLKFLVGEKSFNEDRVKSALEKWKKMRSGSVQGRLDDYFKKTPAAASPIPKRKRNEKTSKIAAKTTAKTAATHKDKKVKPNSWKR